MADIKQIQIGSTIYDINAASADALNNSAELITVDDIDTICGTDILLSSETTF